VNKPAELTDTAGAAVRGLATVSDPKLGLGELLRVEITNWVIRFNSNGKVYSYSPSARQRLSIVDDRTPSRSFTYRLPAASVAMPVKKVRSSP